MSRSGNTRISEADLKALRLRRIGAYVHDESGSTDEGDKKKKGKSAAQRKKEERDRLIADQLDQFNSTMSVFPDKRETIARAAAKVEDDAIQTAIELVITDDPRARELILRVRDNPDGLDAATLALSNPNAVERGLRTLHEDVVALIDAIISDDQIRRILQLILFKSDAGGVNNFLHIVETIATRPETARVVEKALTLPTAVYVGANVLALLEGRGWIADRIISRLSVLPP
jgi:Trp operon repressor